MRLRVGDRACRIAYGCFLAAFLAWALPVLPSAVEDQGIGFQLASGQQVGIGEHPFLDFHSVYGPLVTYASAAALKLSEGRLAGEMGLDAAGLWLGYLGLCALLLQATRSRGVALGLAVTAALCFPRVWKYWVVLGPVLALAGIWAWTRRPTRLRLFGAGAGVALAGLFRQDLGAYAFLAGALAVLAVQPGAGPRRLAGYALCVWLSASPYLLFAASRGGLGSYLHDSVFGSLGKAGSFALPFPALHWSAPLWSQANALAWLYAFFHLLPLVALAVFWSARHALAPAERARWLSALVLAGLCLLQAAHRSDASHLYQALPLSFVLLALVWGASPGLFTVGRRRVAQALWSAVVAFTLVVLMQHHGLPAAEWTLQREKLAAYRSSRVELLAHLSRTRPEDWQVAAARGVRRCTPDGSRILVLPWRPWVYYLAERPYAGTHWVASPGYFDRVEQQRESIAAIEEHRPPLALVDPHFAYDRDPRRTLPRTHPVLWDHLRATYPPLLRIGSVDLGVRADLPEPRARALRRCLTRRAFQPVTGPPGPGSGSLR